MDREHPDSGHPFTPGPTMTRDEFHGMTLRDYFAGQAIGGLMGDCKMPDDESIPHIAERAYAMADAMLKARKVEP